LSERSRLTTISRGACAPSACQQGADHEAYVPILAAASAPGWVDAILLSVAAPGGSTYALSISRPGSLDAEFVEQAIHFIEEQRIATGPLARNPGLEDHTDQ